MRFLARWGSALLLGIPLLAVRAAMPVQVEPGHAWPALAEQSLAVGAGTALDLSPMFPGGPIAETDRLFIKGDGFATRDGVMPRLFCATLVLSPSVGGFPSHDDADRYAVELRRRGYNLVRFHFADATLMTGRQKDNDFDPVQLDRLHYLMAAVKRQGVRWLVDGMTSPNGGKGNVEPHRWVQKYRLNLELYWSDSARQDWQDLVEQLWGRRNPYTGQSTLADPALMGVILVNENNIRFLQFNERSHPGLVGHFKAWLLSKAAADPALALRWPQPGHEDQLAANFEAALRKPDRSPRTADVERFLTDTETAAFADLSARIRKLGYEGPVTMLHTWFSAQANASRAALPWVDMHHYHDHPSDYTHRGSRIENTSSLPSAIPLVRDFAGARISGKPFTVSEYGQPFWNSFRHEAALTVPAAAALQGWSALCRMAENSVNLDYRSKAERLSRITPFMIGLDPVARAGETLAALLYRRGDAAATVDVPPALARALGKTGPGGAQFELISPRTEAAVVEPGRSLTLKTLAVSGGTARAVVAASDIGQAATLADSRHLLLTVITDALNTGMKFDGERRQVLVEPGMLPARIEPIRIRVRLSLSMARDIRVYALDLTGRRTTTLSTSEGPAGELELAIDTAMLAPGPSIFFEVVGTANQ